MYINEAVAGWLGASNFDKESVDLLLNLKLKDLSYFMFSSR